MNTATAHTTPAPSARIATPAMLTPALTARPGPAALARVLPFIPGSEPEAEMQTETHPHTATPGTHLASAATPDLRGSLITGRRLLELVLPPRPALLGQWMRQGDLGYLFAPRGAGKSWMALLIARSIATGSPLGEWQAGQQALPVCYFDAEMNLPDVQDRVRSTGLDVPGFSLLSNEMIFQSQGHGLNIANPAHQEAVSATLPDGCLFIIDNLSTSQLGMAENDNDSFDAIRDWLLSLRHRAITVLIVHHAGRNGLMRGSSRREDMAHWILSLKEAGEPGQPAHRTLFSTEFTKCRNCTTSQARPLLWTLDTSTVPLTLGCDSHEERDVLLDHIRNGVRSASDLAAMMGVHIGTVSRAAHRLEKSGLISIRNRQYYAVEEES